MSGDFDVISGRPPAPPKIKPAPLPAPPEPRRSAETERLAAIPREEARPR